jgi:hypothetical protein
MVGLCVAQCARGTIGEAPAVRRINERRRIGMPDSRAPKKIVKRRGDAGRPAVFTEDHRQHLMA